MSKEILNLEPKRIWYYFNEICKIPHGSRNEAGLRNHLIELAGKFGCSHKVDNAGNLVVKKRAHPNAKNAPTLILQGHLDMVCEKTEGLDHDFTKDPIKPVIDGEWVKAQGTTLGADNGLGLASALAIMESDDIEHGPLEFVFTVGEEPGLFGALDFDARLISGKTLINMDCEEDGILYIGCAGAYDIRLITPITKVNPPAGYAGMEIKISGLRGGHSGIVIHEQRGNALKILGRLLYCLDKKYDGILASANGGTAYNVIPNLVHASIVVKAGKYVEAENSLKEWAERIKAELKKVDPDLKIEFNRATITKVIKKEISDKLISAMLWAPYGVDVMSYDIPGLVQTSSNFAIIKTEEDYVKMTYSSRSSSASQLKNMKDRVLAFANYLDAEVEIGTEYPGWLPDVDSKILALLKKTYKEQFKDEAKVTAIHAGLECGVLGDKAGGLDMVAFGPWLEHVHSVNERANIKSTEKFWKWLVKSVEAFAKG